MASRKNIFFLIFVILFSFNFSQAQPDIGIGQWKSHLPYQVGKFVTQSEEDIIYATIGELFISTKMIILLELWTKKMVLAELELNGSSTIKRMMF